MIGFLSCAAAWFNDLGIECKRVMSVNGPAYNPKAIGMAYRSLGLRHIRAKRYTPRIKVKAERFIQTLCRDCADAMAFTNSEERDRWLIHYLQIYRRIRKHPPSG